MGRCDALFTPRPLGPIIEIAGPLGGELEALVAGEAPPHRVVTALRECACTLPRQSWSCWRTFTGPTRRHARRVAARRAARGTGVLIICTYRDDELTARHPLRVVLGRARDVGQRRAATGWNRCRPSAVAELAATEAVDAAQLHRRTGGNPFFVTEVLAAAADRIPDTVRDAVLARAARMADRARALLEAISVVPPRIDLRLLEALAGPSFAGIDECVASGMIVGGPEGVAFRHELARLAIEESLAPARALELHRAALRALTDRGDPELARLAHHAEAAGDDEAVLRFAPAAGARASSVGAHREAAAQYARALGHAGGAAADLRAELLERLASSPTQRGSSTLPSRPRRMRSRSGASSTTGVRRAMACDRSGGSSDLRAGRMPEQLLSPRRSQCSSSCPQDGSWRWPTRRFRSAM